jgi:hypothetical protein
MKAEIEKKNKNFSDQGILYRLMPSSAREIARKIT